MNRAVSGFAIPEHTFGQQLPTGVGHHIPPERSAHSGQLILSRLPNPRFTPLQRSIQQALGAPEALNQHLALALGQGLMYVAGINTVIRLNQVGAGPIPALVVGWVITLDELSNRSCELIHLLQPKTQPHQRHQ